MITLFSSVILVRASFAFTFTKRNKITARQMFNLQTAIVASDNTMSNFISRVTENNNYSESQFNSLTPFVIGDIAYGYVSPEFAERF